MPIRIAVTGGSGFIGTNTIQFYIDKGIDVMNIDISEPRDRDHLKYWYKADILDLTALKGSIKEFLPTHLIHLAARTDLDEAQDINKYAVNIKGVENIIEAISTYRKIERTIFASTMLVCKRGHAPKNYDDYMPTTLYGKSKVLAEKIIKEQRGNLSEWLIIRPTCIWGPWFGQPYRNFFNLVINDRYFHPGNSSCTKTFGYVKNTICQMDRLLFCNEPNINQATFYLGDYTPLNIAEWADSIAKALDRRPCKQVPITLFKISALIGDSLQRAGFRRFPMNNFRLKNMTEDNIIDLSAIHSIISPLPYSVEDGIRETLAWIE